MNEQSPNEFEINPERIPTPEEVEAVFKQLIGGATYETTRKIYDEEGLSLWDVKIETEGEEGYTEYGYDRVGKPNEGEKSPIVIYVAFYGVDDIPYAGKLVAEFIDGEWKMNP